MESLTATDTFAVFTLLKKNGRPTSAYSPADREQDLCWRIGWLNTGQVMHRHLQLLEIHESSVLSAFIAY